MAYPIPFNRRGIYGIKSIGTPAVGATDITLHFEEHPYVAMPYNGILIVNLTEGLPRSTETNNLPVMFQTGNGAKVAAKKQGGAALTGGDITYNGYYLFFFDRNTGVLQLFN